MKRKFLKKAIMTIVTAIIFFAVTMPFRKLFQVVSVTEIRPAAALNPTFGLLFGLWGALGCALGNLIADILSGYSPLMCILGFAVQMIYGLIPCFVWKKSGEEIRLNSSVKILRYMVISAINSAVTAILLGLTMFITGIGEIFSTTVLMMFLNNFIFCVVLGIPIILANTSYELKKSGKSFSLNERFIPIFLFLAILSAAMIGTFAFGEMSGNVSDKLSLWNKVYGYIAADLIVFSVVIVCFLFYAEKNITFPLEKLSHIAGKYSENETGIDTKWIVDECRKYEKVHGEAGELAAAFREMALNIDDYVERITRITAENERIGAELNVARQIQADMLPRIFPAFPERKEFYIYASMTPAKEVGGDFYDFFLVDDEHLALVIADVSGKGVPAALFMVIAKTLIKNRALMGGTPAEILNSVNDQLCEGNKAEFFVTVWLAIIDLSTGKGVAANAGHEYPAIRRKNGKFELIRSRHSPAVAAMEGIKFREHEFELHQGDTIFVYTDGVPEATDQNNELFGTDRMLTALDNAEDSTPQGLLKAVSDEVNLFVGNAPQFDDLTMLGLKFFGKGADQGE